MAKQKLKTEHSGPKNGGGYWGARKEAKKLSNKTRRSQGRKESKSTEKLIDESTGDPKVHPWRLCPLGRHWVRTHPLSVEPSEKNPDGKTIRHSHCADNPNRGKGKKAKYGELKDHYVKISRDDAYDPNLSVSAGIRWLFYKKEWASNKLGREASWDDAIAAYKGYLPGIISGKNPNPTGMQNIRKHYQELK